MKHILIVDDVVFNLKYAADVLRDTYEISTVKSGEKALQFLQERIPDLILLDVNMPEMDGYEVMKCLKENEVFQDIPVVFLSAETDGKSELKGLKMGAMDYIKKPFEPEIMRSRISTILEISEQKKALQKIARRDGLTDLLNRRSLETLLGEADSREHGYFLLLDLDNFKQVNDTCGHLVGDKVLVKFAQVLVRETEGKGTAYRLGGDEFAVYIPGERDQEEVGELAQQIIAETEFEIQEMLPDTFKYRVSVSVGIARKVDDGNCFMDLYSMADKALYYIKQNGKRGFHFYMPADEERREEENHIIDVIQLQRLIQEKGCEADGYRVEYDGFMRIYDDLSQRMERTGQDIQLVLFTVQDVFEHELEGDGAEKAIACLEESVTSSLRRRDLAVRCGSLQYLVILINASYANGNMVVNRIQRKFDGLIQDPSIRLGYEIRTVCASEGEAG